MAVKLNFLLSENGTCSQNFPLMEILSHKTRAPPPQKNKRTFDMSTAAGLKEFADGDAALFNGSLMMNLDSEEDFENEFRRLLTEGTSALFTSETSTGNIGSSCIESYTGSYHESRDFITTPVLSEDFYTSPSVDSNSTMKFEEDPLSTILNKQTAPKPAEVKKKRGRPSSLKFKNMQYFEEQSRIHSVKKNTSSTTTSTIIPSQLHMRDRRTDDDNYSPVWIRGRGVDREGLCPLCIPSVWLKIKQSAYWYHMNFYHGICAATGRPYKRPINYRFNYEERNCKRVVEGHCGTCLQWVQLASDFDGSTETRDIEEKINFTTWYKHAQKCHYRTKEFHIPSYFS